MTNRKKFILEERTANFGRDIIEFAKNSSKSNDSPFNYSINQFRNYDFDI